VVRFECGAKRPRMSYVHALKTEDLMVHITATAADITTSDADAIVVNLFDGVISLTGGTGVVDKALDGAISALITDKEITGKQGEIAMIHTLGKLPAKRVVVLGLGKRDKLNAAVLRQVSATVARHLKRIGAKRAATLAHGAGIGGLDARAAGQAIAEGSILGLYTFSQYKSKKDDQPERDLEYLEVIEQDAGRLPALTAGLAKGVLLSEAVSIARGLVNEPANVVNPVKMAEVASEIAVKAGLGISILHREDMVKHKMGAMLAVTQGSANEPRLIIMEHRGDPENPENNIALVGKGITFDSGGISIKSAGGMWEMKGDMAGGASVIGAMYAIAALKPKLNVFGVVPAVENMPSGTAQRPGDIIRAMNGKTIEVDNTDAEGRLVLADAICYVKEQMGAKRVVDIATLTGAIVVALGHVATGVFGTSQSMVDAVLAASKETGEKMWQLPMFEEYKRQNRSEYADVKNTGGRAAGSIAAAFFISEFTDGVEWAHLDIAGTFMAERTHGHEVKGATGIPTRTLVKLIEQLAAS
jgi:leucyl aminopeptidase